MWLRSLKDESPSVIDGSACARKCPSTLRRKAGALSSHGPGTDPSGSGRKVHRVADPGAPVRWLRGFWKAVDSAVETSSPVGAADYPKGFSSGVLSALEAVRVPAYIVDLQRRVRRQNAASIELVGALRGRLDASVLCADDLARAREAFSRKLKGASHAEVEVSVARRDGKQVGVAISTAPVKDADAVISEASGLCMSSKKSTRPSRAHRG
jgi:PAS domain-containing protein